MRLCLVSSKENSGSSSSENQDNSLGCKRVYYLCICNRETRTLYVLWEVPGLQHTSYKILQYLPVCAAKDPTHPLAAACGRDVELEGGS